VGVGADHWHAGQRLHDQLLDGRCHVAGGKEAEARRRNSIPRVAGTKRGSNFERDCCCLVIANTVFKLVTYTCTVDRDESDGQQFVSYQTS
jgi:hypothetical protein